MGLIEANVSELLGYRLAGFSLGRLMTLLLALSAHDQPRDLAGSA